MEWFGSLLNSQPFIALFLVMGLGYAVGNIQVAGFSLGVGAVLFVGLLIGVITSRYRWHPRACAFPVRHRHPVRRRFLPRPCEPRWDQGQSPCARGGSSRRICDRSVRALHGHRHGIRAGIIRGVHDEHRLPSSGNQCHWHPGSRDWVRLRLSVRRIRPDPLFLSLQDAAAAEGRSAGAEAADHGRASRGFV
jgi:hypothetical protein